MFGYKLHARDFQLTGDTISLSRCCQRMRRLQCWGKLAFQQSRSGTRWIFILTTGD